MIGKTLTYAISNDILDTQDEVLIADYFLANCCAAINTDVLDCMIGYRSDHSEALRYLISAGYIVPSTFNSYVVNKEAFNLQRNFTYIYESEFKAIMGSGEHNRLALLKHFLNVVRTINNETHIGFTAAETFAMREHTTIRTIYRLNAQLRELDLVGAHRREGQQSTIYWRSLDKINNELVK